VFQLRFLQKMVSNFTQSQALIVGSKPRIVVRSAPNCRFDAFFFQVFEAITEFGKGINSVL
jgi:hypothetical protein